MQVILTVLMAFALAAATTIEATAMKVAVTAFTAFNLAVATTIPAETTHVTKFCHYRDPKGCPKDQECWLVDDTGVPLDPAHNTTAGNATDASALTAAQLYLLSVEITVCAGQDAEKCCPLQNRLCAILATDAVKLEAVGYFWHGSPDVTVADLAEVESDAPSSGVALDRRGYSAMCQIGCPFWCQFSVECLKYSLGTSSTTLDFLLGGRRGGILGGIGDYYGGRGGYYGGRGGILGGIGDYYGGRGGYYGGRGGILGGIGDYYRGRGYSRGRGPWPKPATGMSAANSANMVAANDDISTHSCDFFCPAGAMWCFCPSWCNGRCNARASDDAPVSATSGLDTTNDDISTHSCDFYCRAGSTWCFCPKWCNGRCNARDPPVSATSGLDTTSTSGSSDVSTTSSLDTASTSGPSNVSTTSRPIDVSAKIIRARDPRGAPKTKTPVIALTTPIPYEEPDCPAICRPKTGCFCPAHCRLCSMPAGRSKAKPATVSSPGELVAEDWEPCVLTFYREADHPIGRTATEYKKSVTVTTSIDCRGCAATTRVITFPAATPTVTPSTTVTKRKTTSTVSVCVDNTQGMTCGVDLIC